MSNALYRIEELSTSGWFVVERHEKMTKEQTEIEWNHLLANGVSPDRLRIVRDNEGPE
jgi:hypothetical protein|tara:strand:+ start:275 stop:448 length:174 start_codon:yes stop_codon:yes gene_type:complete